MAKNHILVQVIYSVSRRLKDCRRSPHKVRIYHYLFRLRRAQAGRGIVRKRSDEEIEAARALMSEISEEEDQLGWRFLYDMPAATAAGFARKIDLLTSIGFFELDPEEVFAVVFELGVRAGTGSTLLRFRSAAGGYSPPGARCRVSQCEVSPR